jgi:hypothetical protein
MAIRLLPVLLVTTCYLQANGFSPAGIISQKFEIETIRESLPTVEDTSYATEENLLDSLPPVIQQIADERREFQMNLGKAMDTLRKDMPDILKRAPGM